MKTINFKNKRFVLEQEDFEVFAVTAKDENGDQFLILWESYTEDGAIDETTLDIFKMNDSLTR
jgi:hypothetical protein